MIEKCEYSELIRCPGKEEGKDEKVECLACFCHMLIRDYQLFYRVCSDFLIPFNSSGKVVGSARGHTELLGAFISFVKKELPDYHMRMKKLSDEQNENIDKNIPEFIKSGYIS